MIDEIHKHTSFNSLGLAFGFESRSTQLYRFVNSLRELYPDEFDDYKGQGWNKDNFNMSLFTKGSIFNSDMRVPLIRLRGLLGTKMDVCL